jgi:hypothetical protein
MMRFSDIPISEDFRNPAPGSKFTWNGHEHLVRTGQYQATGPHPKQVWVFHGREIVEAEELCGRNPWR